MQIPASSTYNADESGLPTVPNKLPMMVSRTGSRSVSKIVSAERGRNVTIICCISATGFYLPPFLIFARKRILPELVGKAPPERKHHHGWVATPHITSSRPLMCQFFGPLKTYYSQTCDNFMVTHPGQTITDKNIEWGIESHNPLGISECDFAAAKTGDHDGVGDATENNSANPQTLAVETQHITPSPPEEPEITVNAGSNAPRSLLVLFISNHCLKQHNVRKKRKSKKVSSSILTNTPIKEILEETEKQKEERETLRKQRREVRETKKGAKKLKLSSCRPKSIKFRPKSPVASTTKDCVIRCPACEEEYCDPPTEERIQCCKSQEWWHEECSNYENGIFICDYC
ncbi:DDE-1 domain-containing protein [Trichonephila clavipes]|nr:DDE-1 domain-containing protein [Trichonephila clavipes]